MLKKINIETILFQCCIPAENTVSSYTTLKQRSLNIGIKHGFSCINIRQVPREVLKTEAGNLGFQHFPIDLANVNALKTMFDPIIALKRKPFATFRVISCTILFRLFTDVSRTQFPRTMLVPGLCSTHLVTATILWPRYEYIESCIAVH